MIRFFILLAFAVGGNFLLGAEAGSLSAASSILNPEAEGRELAARLRASAPAENSEFTGILEITGRDDSQRFVPILSRVTVSPTNWLVVYQSKPTNSEPAETLTIAHTPDRKLLYTLTVGTNATAVPLLTRPFAGSDFWLVDLGLDFIHWPQQRVLKAEMRRGQPCRVLESVDPSAKAGGYGRVQSWIDNETGGIIEAEAYDAGGKLLKRFALGSFKKVEGQWQLRNMRIRNVQTGQRTDLKFDLKTK